jgi:ABC-type branched-subunit amino acid transport system ATPase component/ABC-type branched-subunit amino acid transport system permease subunit
VFAAGWITNNLVFKGVVNGAAIGLLALGIVLVYRATRVINFAVAGMGVLAASLLPLLVLQYGFPFWIALPICLFTGTLYGLIVELTVVRRLFKAPRVILLIATMGVAQLSQALTTALPRLDEPNAKYPAAMTFKWKNIRGVDISGAQLSVLIMVPVIAGLLAWFLNRTMLGQTVKASAENSELSRLSGISPKFASSLVWTIAGLISSISVILLAGLGSNSNAVGSLGPVTLTRALAAAVIAGMTSFPRALAAGIGIGVLQALLQFNFTDLPSLIDVAAFLFVLAAVWRQSRRSAETSTFSFAPKARPIPPQLQSVWWVRNIGALTMGTVGLIAAAAPFVITKPSRILLFGTVLTFAICALSVSVLTGWSGQLSLGQMAFAGLGALGAAALQRGLEMDIGWGDNRLIKGSLPGMHFLPATLVSCVLVAAFAAIIGIGSLRVRGLLLAVTTFAFGIAAESYLYRRPIFSNGKTGQVAFPRESIGGISMASQRNYYLFVLVMLFLILGVVSRLRRSGVGWSTIAVRDNERTASAYTVAATRVKLQAFALSGGIAALGGALLANLLGSVPLGDRFFTVSDSVKVVAMAVIGGLGSTTGPILGAIWIEGLPAFFPGNALLPLLSSSLGLLILLMYFPGGLMQVVYLVRDAIFDRAAARQPIPEAVPKPSVVLATRERRPVPAEQAGAVQTPWLCTTGLTVTYGGLRAVDGVSIEVKPREIVGLIGTNGAGKTSFMNAIGGYVPSKGRVELLGHDVSDSSSHRRAAMGMGRTFQSATLFPELTVRETVLVALEARGHTGLIGTALASPLARRGARARRSEADDLIGFLGLGRYADASISDLSTGTRRIVELAGLLAVDARVLCLDEPTAGVAQRETEAFGPLIVGLCKELDASILVIEHDMPLIMSISHRVYCFEQGAVIAEGAPEAIRQDPRVIASYLGLDERAIARSGTEVNNQPQPQPI